MRVLLLHPDDDFHGSWTRQHWDSVIDLGRAPKSFYDERSAALGCPVFSIFDLAIEVEDMQIWRHLFQPGMGRVVDRFGIDWWDVISHSAAAGIAGCAARASVGRKAQRMPYASGKPAVGDGRSFAVAIGNTAASAQPGIARSVWCSSVLRRGGAVADLSFVQLRQVVYDKYDPHYRWRRKLAGSPAQSSKSENRNRSRLCCFPSAYSNVTKTALSYARILPEQKFLLVLARESEPSRRFRQMCRRRVWRALQRRSATGMNCRNLKPAGSRWSSRSQNIRHSGCRFSSGS